MAADGSEITWLHVLLNVYAKSASVHGNWKNTITMSLQKVKEKKTHRSEQKIHMKVC